MSLLDLLRSLLTFLGFKKKADRVVITGASIIHFGSDGAQEFMHWDDLAEVAVLTGSGDTLVSDVYIVLTAFLGPSAMSIPQGAEGVDKLLAALKKLPGFDSEVLTQAMSSTGVERFICWQRSVPPVGAGDDSSENECF